MMPAVSAGSNQPGASETWTAQVTWPSGAARAGDEARRGRNNAAIRARRSIFDPPLHRE